MSTEPTAPKRRRGRPATGRKTNAEYKRQQRADLEQAGGRRLSLNLRPEGAEDLDLVKASHGTSDTEAVHIALRNEAKRLRRSKTSA